MRFVLINVLKFTMLFITFLSLITNTKEHKGGKSRGDNLPIKDDFKPYGPPRTPKGFMDVKVFVGEVVDEVDENFRHKNKHHHKGLKINSYNQEDQFLKGSEICPEHSILINGDCVTLVDVGLINFLAMFIAGGLCLLIFISIVICLVFLYRRCKRKFNIMKKIKKAFGFKRIKMSNNSHQNLNENHDQHENLNNNSFNNSNNQINPQANYENNNVYNHSNRANYNVSNYSNVGKKVAINPNNDFSMYPSLFINNQENNNNSYNNALHPSVNNLNNSTMRNLNENNFLGKKINGILNYFPSLGKKLMNNNTINKNNGNEVSKATQVEMNSKNKLNKVNPIAKSNPSNLQRSENKNIQNNQNIPKQPMNPYIQRQYENIIQEDQFVLANNNYICDENYDQSKFFV